MDATEIRAIYRRRMAKRAAGSPEDRDTFRTCPSCLGAGLIPRSRVGPSYIKLVCPYCDGHGVTDAHMTKLFEEQSRT